MFISAVGSAGRDMRHALRRSIALILAVFMAAGCSKAVEIPRGEIDDAKFSEPGSYRVRTRTGEEYRVRRYSTTDSTIVVEELISSDELFGKLATTSPFAIPRSEVASIAQMRSSVVPVIGIGVVAVVVLLIILSITKPLEGLGGT